MTAHESSNCPHRRPGAGKTVISRRWRRIARPFRPGPEAATQVYDALRTRWDRLTLDGRHDVQAPDLPAAGGTGDRLAAEHPDKTPAPRPRHVDGAAYWPGGADDYWRDLGTTASGRAGAVRDGGVDADVRRGRRL